MGAERTEVEEAQSQIQLSLAELRKEKRKGIIERRVNADESSKFRYSPSSSVRAGKRSQVATRGARGLNPVLALYNVQQTCMSSLVLSQPMVLQEFDGRSQKRDASD